MEVASINHILEITTLFNFQKIMLIVMALIFFWSINKLLKKGASLTINQFPVKRFLISQAFTLFTFFWYFAAFYIIVVFIIQPPKELMVALMGGLVVALGIALKDVAASIISGFILLFERPFQVGDRVSFDDKYGEIVSIGLRSVRLNTLSDDLLTIPNASFITQSVATANAGALEMMVVCDFHLSLDADIELARSIVHEVVVSSRFVFIKKPITFLLNEVVVAERLALMLRCKAYVFDVKYEKNFQSDVYHRVCKIFSEKGLKRPVIDP